MAVLVVVVNMLVIRCSAGIMYVLVKVQKFAAFFSTVFRLSQKVPTTLLFL